MRNETLHLLPEARQVSGSKVPVISGFYPDPSVCLHDGKYYLVTSTFEYRPGIPVFESDDLVNWHQIGHVLERASQLPDDGGRPSSGIYAPTIRHHDGKFWVACTNVQSERSEQFIVHATDPAGPWSDPVFTTGMYGIDPDLSWRDDDCFLTWSTSDPKNPAILQARIDPSTGRGLCEPYVLWRGTGLAYPEAPHLYHVGDWWYLMLAEGGTERGHSITIARSRSIDGPFEGAPRNPIFSRRSILFPVQNTGHGDLVRTREGDWAMVYLGVRPRGTSPGFHVIGRETFVARVTWPDGWPEIDAEHYRFRDPSHAFVDRFDDNRLHSRWVSPGVFPESIVEFDQKSGVLLHAGPPSGHGTFLLTRVTDLDWKATFSIAPLDGQVTALLRMDDDHWCGLRISEGHVCAISTMGGHQVELASRQLRDDDGGITVQLRARPNHARFAELGGPDTIEMGILKDGAYECLATCDGRYTSTEVAGGFTGRLVGFHCDQNAVRLLCMVYSGGSSREGGDP